MQNRLRPQFLGVAHALPHVPLVCVKRTGCGTDLYYHDTSATASLPPSFIHASSKNTQQLDKTHVSLTPVPHPQTCYITPPWLLHQKNTLLHCKRTARQSPCRHSLCFVGGAPRFSKCHRVARREQDRR